MSNCFNCNGDNARYSRYLETGNSTSYSRSKIYSNTHYGNRFLCEECAYDYDYSILSSSVTKRKILIFVLVIILIIRFV